jgi:hypothetical protein
LSKLNATKFVKLPNSAEKPGDISFNLPVLDDAGDEVNGIAAPDGTTQDSGPLDHDEIQGASNTNNGEDHVPSGGDNEIHDEVHVPVLDIGESNGENHGEETREGIYQIFGMIWHLRQLLNYKTVVRFT